MMLHAYVNMKSQKSGKIELNYFSIVFICF